MTDSSRCTCPEPEHTGPGVPILMPGRSHKRGCPVVADIFDMMDRQASDAAERHVRRGGIVPTPGEREARRSRDEIADLRRRIEQLEMTGNHNVRVTSTEDPVRYRASCTGCGWWSDVSNDEDAVIDAHQKHREAQP